MNLLTPKNYDDSDSLSYRRQNDEDNDNDNDDNDDDDDYNDTMTGYRHHQSNCSRLLKILC